MGVIEEKFKWDGQLPKPSNMKFSYEDANALSNAGGSTGATLTVAASDALHPERADYKCNGVNDEATIQEAIDALPTIDFWNFGPLKSRDCSAIRRTVLYTQSNHT